MLEKNATSLRRLYHNVLLEKPIIRLSPLGWVAALVGCSAVTTPRPRVRDRARSAAHSAAQPHRQVARPETWLRRDSAQLSRTSGPDEGGGE